MRRALKLGVWLGVLACLGMGAQALAQTPTPAPAPPQRAAVGVSSALPTVQSAVSAPPVAAEEASLSPRVQARWDRIAGELRCLVCQNESLASSSAELAVDLRREVRQLIEQDQSDAQIRAFLVSRYGDFVLYKPEVKPLTWLLWFGPFALLLLALAVALRLMRRQPAAAAPLSEQERERVRQLLEP